MASRTNRLRVTGGIAATSLVALGLTGCAANSSSASDGEITVMTIGNWTQPASGAKYPEYPAGVQARAAAINKAGGINGRKIKVIACSDELNPNIAQQCARQAVSEGVTAVVGLQTQNETSILPILEKAGVAAIGVSPFTDLGYSSKVSFPDVSGYYGLTLGQGLQCAKAGASKVSNVLPSGFGTLAEVNATLVKKGVEHGGAAFTSQVQIPQNTPDLTPVIASATSKGEDGVTGFAFDEPSFINAMHHTAPHAKFCTTTFNLSAQVLKNVGGLAEGVMAPSPLVPPTAQTPGTQKFAADMKAYNSAYGLTDVGLHEWLAMWTFERVAGGVKDLGAKSFLDAMGKVRNLDMGGITPPYSTVSTSTVYPRAFNTTAVFEIVKGGKLVMQDPSNPFVQMGDLFQQKFS